MPVLINFKICDNCDACNAIGVCPTGAFKWNDNKKTLEVEREKCIECGLCATSQESCQVGAIRYAKNEQEYQRIKEEIDKDERTIADLMVDRYGAQPINMPFYCEDNEIDKILTTSKICMIEIFKEEYIECLIKSIPIKEIIELTENEIVYRKMEVKNEDFIKKYDIKEFPSLLLFKDNKLLGKIEGYYDESLKEELINKIKDILSNQ